MAEEQEAARCLEAFHEEEETPISPLFTIVPRNVYSCEPGELPGPVDMDQNKKLYYSMNVTDRVMTSSGPSRKTPRGHWKSRDGHKAIIINSTAHGFKQRFKYISGEPQEENIKWAMIEYTLYPPKSKENKFALCYVYRTKQDGRQKNGRPQSNVPPIGTSYTVQGCSEPLIILGSNEGGKSTDDAIWCEVLGRSPLHISSWNFPEETYEALELECNGNGFLY